MNSECDNIKEKIADLVSGMLSESQVQTVEQHLDECAGCREYASALKHEDVLLTEFFAQIETNMTERQERVVKAINRSYVSEQSDKLSIRRIIMKSRITKLAALAAIIVLVSIGISYIAKDHPGSVALGEVFEAMQQVKTATWTSIREFVPPEDMTGIVRYSVDGESHSAYKAPGLEREEVVSRNMHVSGGGRYLDERRWIHIYDYNAGKSLLLNPEKMTASVNTFEPAHRIASLFDAFLSPKTGIPPDAEPLGTRQIDGREAFGFRFHLKGDGTDFLMGDVSEIWVDATTKLLVLAETRDDENRWVATLKDFVFNLELDDSLFIVEVPEGYTEIAPRPFSSLSPPEKE